MDLYPEEGYREWCSIRPASSTSPNWESSRSATTSSIRVGVFVGVVRAGSEPGPLPRLHVVPANEALSVRRRRDSNPRYPVERYNTLAGCRLQPLGHSSGSQQYIKDMLRLRAPAPDPSPSRLRLWSLRR